MMVLKCGRIFVALLMPINIVIQGCFGENSTSEVNAKNTILFESGHIVETLDNETVSETKPSDSSNKFEGYLRETARKKDNRGDESIMDKILPILIIPFLVSSSMIPAMLFSIKVLLIKSALIGKIAVILMLLSYFRRRVDTGGVYNHYPQDLMKEHYGYQGWEEPGAYVNKRRRRQMR